MTFPIWPSIVISLLYPFADIVVSAFSPSSFMDSGIRCLDFIGGNRRKLTSSVCFIKKLDVGNDSDMKSKAHNNDVSNWLKALITWEQEKSVKTNDINKSIDDYTLNSLPLFDGVEVKSGRSWEDELSPMVASLIGMINLEALIAATNFDVVGLSENETINNETMVLSGTVSGSLKSSEKDAVNVQRSIEDENISTTKLFSFLEGALRWGQFVPLLQKNVQELRDVVQEDESVTNEEVVTAIGGMVDLMSRESLKSDTSAIDTNVNPEKLLRYATKNIEVVINGATSSFSPSIFQNLVLRATNPIAVQEASSNLTTAMKILFEEASKAPRATAKYTAELIEFTNRVLVDGYVANDSKGNEVISQQRKPIFINYSSVRDVPKDQQQQAIVKATDYATLCGAIYENTIPVTRNLGHSIVAQGKTADIGWMITDSLQNNQDYNVDASAEPTLVRSFIFRGFDATDEAVNRESLLNTISAATPVPIKHDENTLIKVHGGLLSIANELFPVLQTYLDWTSPTHKFVFAGHSIGGSISIIILLLLSQWKSVTYVDQKVLRVFTFGSPPVLMLETNELTSNFDEIPAALESCHILQSLELRTDLVYGYNQPWDPIIRLFTKYDPLYPLIDDIGEDGVTLYSSGPARTLRPITKALLETWKGWPSFRDNARLQLEQNYLSVGKQFLLLPEPIRYLSDRIVSVNTAVPRVDSILQVSARELLPALNEVYPLNTFSISLVPVAIRSLLHHLFPAYGSPFIEYASRFKNSSSLE